MKSSKQIILKINGNVYVLYILYTYILSPCNFIKNNNHEDYDKLLLCQRIAYSVSYQVLNS